MVKLHSEKIKSDFEGTIIDIETIGDFRRKYNDSRQYKEIIPVIFGFIDENGLKIHCSKTQASIEKLKKEIVRILPELETPFYAFNSEFERGSLFHYLGFPVDFHRELNDRKFESKSSAIRMLTIPDYDDPFHDNGKLCMEAWLKGEINESIAHNRSCLLKERDILLKRGFRIPDELILIE